MLRKQEKGKLALASLNTVPTSNDVTRGQVHLVIGVYVAY